MRELKILLVNTGIFPLPPEKAGGTEYHIYHLANNLAKLGVSVHLVSDIRDGSYFHSNVTIHPTKALHAPMRGGFTSWLLNHAVSGIFSFKSALKEIVIKTPIDLVHIHGRVGALLTTFINCKHPFVYSLHDQSPWNDLYPKLEGLIRRVAYTNIEARVARRVDYVIAVSKQVRWELIKRWGIPPEKVTFISNGVDMEAFKPSVKKDPIILFVGKLTRRKGVEYLIRAYAEVASEDYRLFIVGDGEERSRLEKLVGTLNLQRNVKFLGYISRGNLEALYARARIYVLPSMAEGFPLSLLEAIASGCAVVATNVSGVSDVVNNENGFIVEPGSVDALAEKLSLLIEDQKTTEYMGSIGRKSISKQYSWGSIASKTFSVYERSLNE